MSSFAGILRTSRNGVALASIAMVLSACEDGPKLDFLKPKPNADITSSDGSSVPAANAGSTKLVERDVEAPDVFQVTEAGLWDGRPSLGGVWVAHPDVSEPERVIIRNAANNKFVIGALFRRERDIPGPRIQASSDAAGALGMLAGAPVQLNVTALRREEVAPDPVPAAPLREDDLVADAASAIDAPAGQATPDPVETAAAPAKKKFQWPWQRKKAEAQAPLDAMNAATDAAVASVEPVETATLAPASSPKPAAPAPKPQPKPSTLKKPFIQIGIFSVEANANRTANQIRSTGIVPTVYEQSSNGKKFWRVVVGPSRSKSEQSGLLKKIKGIGFSDAYYVTN